MKTNTKLNANVGTSMFRVLLLSAVCGSMFLAAASQPQPFNHPLVFEPNQGQASSEVKWIARGRGYRLYITSDGATIVLRDADAVSPRKSLSPISFAPTQMPNIPQEAPTSVMRMKLNGSRGWNAVTGLEPTGGVSNYLLGNDPKQWQVNIPHYARLQTAGVYDGIDLVLYSHGGELEYDFVVAPYADPKQIRLAFDGVDRMRVDGRGDLLLITAESTELRQLRPRVYQQFGNQQIEVAGAYEILDRKQATFALASYDRRRPLVIDPTVTYTTFLAGSNQDIAQAVAVDGAGNAYVTGFTSSVDFPTVGPIRMDQPGDDAFVTKLSPTGSILFSTYLGGGKTDCGAGIAVDSTGVYVTGWTQSPDFPTQNPFIAFSGPQKAFVTKLSLNGSALTYSTFLGGTSNEIGTAIAVDSAGSAYVTGQTGSTDFPLVTPLQSTNHGNSDAFIVRLTPAGTSLAYSTYWGGSGRDVPYGIAVDRGHFVYITGDTESSDFPVLNQIRSCQIIEGGLDAFVVKLYPGDPTVRYSTCFGAAGSRGTAIATDGAGNAYVTGSTVSTNFPTTVGAFQAVKVSANGSSAFVTKLSNWGALLYSTYLAGATGGTTANGIALTSAGEAYVVGKTSSTDFPMAPPIVPHPTAGFLAKVNATGSRLAYSTLLGAQINGVAVYQPFRLFTATYPTVYTAGYRYTGSLYSTAIDAFVVALDETPVMMAVQ